MQENRVIIIARGESRWYEAVPNLRTYQKKVLLKNCRQTYITPNNCKEDKFELIEAVLKCH
jgi:hypothetical protein